MLKISWDPKKRRFHVSFRGDTPGIRCVCQGWEKHVFTRKINELYQPMSGSKSDTMSPPPLSHVVSSLTVLTKSSMFVILAFNVQC